METPRVNPVAICMTKILFGNRIDKQTNIKRLSFNDESLISPIERLTVNPKLAKENSNIRGRIYILINSYIEKINTNKINPQFLNSQIFEDTFGIQAPEKNVNKFTDKILKISNRFSSQTMIEQAHSMPDNCQKMVKLFTKYFCKLKP